jgi:hypothetical protein
MTGSSIQVPANQREKPKGGRLLWYILGDTAKTLFALLWAKRVFVIIS